MYKYLEIIILAISYVRYVCAPNEPNIDYMIIDLILAGILVFSFYKSNFICAKTVIKHSTIFLVSFVIVYYQYPLDYVLGNKGAVHVVDQPYISQFAKCLCIANVALAAFSIGYRFTKATKKRSVSNTSIRLTPYFSNMLSILFFVLFVITVNEKFIFRGYGIYDKGTLATEFEKIMQMAIIASFAISSYLYNNNTSVNSVKTYFVKFRIPIMILILYSILISVSGSRYVVLRMTSILFVSYIYTVRPKIRIMLLVAGILFLALLSTLQGLTRNRDGTSLSDASGLISRSQSISPLTQEFAFSITTLHIATENIPSKFDYNYGLTLLPEFLFIIPGARSFVFNIFNIPYSETHSTVVITLLGYETLERGGLGSSSIADVYISYGVLGVLCVFLLFGMLLKRIELNTYSDGYCSIYMLAVSFCFYSQMLYLNRESLFTSIVGLPYVLLIVYVSLKTTKN